MEDRSYCYYDCYSTGSITSHRRNTYVACIEFRWLANNTGSVFEIVGIDTNKEEI